MECSSYKATGQATVELSIFALLLCFFLTVSLAVMNLTKNGFKHDFLKGQSSQEPSRIDPSETDSLFRKIYDENHTEIFAPDTTLSNLIRQLQIRGWELQKKLKTPKGGVALLSLQQRKVLLLAPRVRKSKILGVYLDQ